MIYINSGHHNTDPGAVVLVEGVEYVERNICKQIRDLIQFLRPGWIYIPDSLNLTESIELVNKFCLPGDIAVDIHLNSHSDPSQKGCSAYFYRDYALAVHFAQHVAPEVPTLNLGAKDDTLSFVGELGWLRKTKCHAVLVEICYLTNKEDRDSVTDPERQKLIARAFVEAIETWYGHKTDLSQHETEEKTQLQKIIDYLKQKVVELLAQLKQKYGNKL